MKVLVILVILGSSAIAAAKDGCWSPTYGREVGKPISVCHDDEDKNGALCYPKCKEGYHGVGPVCWRICPPGFKDIGVGCQKPKPYGRGAGYVSKKKCLKKHEDAGCQRWGLLWYPKCKDGYHNVACCVCSPNCPEGFTDSGVTCTKHSYGRGAGKPLHCKPNQQYDAGLCYKPCAERYHGVGPVCWHHCPANLTACGAMCLPTKGDCVVEMLSIAEEVAMTVASMAVDPETAWFDLEKTVFKIANDLNLPLCPKD